MKTVKTQLFAMAVTCMMMIGPSMAGAAGSEEKKDALLTMDYAGYLNGYPLENDIEEMMRDEGTVRIINSHEEMVMEGKITDETIKTYMSISDLLTEIDGVKYFRLSYQ